MRSRYSTICRNEHCRNKVNVPRHIFESGCQSKSPEFDFNIPSHNDLTVLLVSKSWFFSIQSLGFFDAWVCRLQQFSHRSVYLYGSFHQFHGTELQRSNQLVTDNEIYIIKNIFLCFVARKAQKIVAAGWQQRRYRHSTPNNGIVLFPCVRSLHALWDWQDANITIINNDQCAWTLNIRHNTSSWGITHRRYTVLSLSHSRFCVHHSPVVNWCLTRETF